MAWLSAILTSLRACQSSAATLATTRLYRCNVLCCSCICNAGYLQSLLSVELVVLRPIFWHSLIPGQMSCKVMHTTWLWWFYLFCVLFYLLSFVKYVCFCSVRFDFTSTSAVDWLGRTSSKWPILCRLGCKTLIKSALWILSCFFCLFIVNGCVWFMLINVKIIEWRT